VFIASKEWFPWGGSELCWSLGRGKAGPPRCASKRERKGLGQTSQTSGRLEIGGLPGLLPRSTIAPERDKEFENNMTLPGMFL
jgi:hypothetical protein